MDTSSEKLSRRTKLLYGLGDWGFSTTGTIISAFLAMFLSDVVHLDMRLAAAAVFVGRSWDWINDPLIGHISDRTRSRWGRRRPFLLFGFIPFGLAFSLLWWIPPIPRGPALACYYALALVLFDTIATFTYMPYFALTPELTLDYDERTSLTSYRMFFSIISGLVAFVVPDLIIGGFRPENAPRALAMGLIFGITSALPLLGVFAGTRERPEFQAQAQPSVRESLRAALGNPPFLFAVGIYLATWMVIDLLLPMLRYYLKYCLGLESQTYLILGIAFGVAALALPLWNWVSHHWNKRYAYMGGMAMLGVVMGAMALLQPGVPLLAVLGLAALAGVGVSAAHVLPWAIIPDAVEYDELKTGSRHEGAFYSLVMLMHKVAVSLVVPAALLILGWAGYVPNAAEQAPRVLTAIRALVGAAPALLLAGGITFAALYPLDRKAHLAVRQELARRRALAAGAAAEGAGAAASADAAVAGPAAGA